MSSSLYVFVLGDDLCNQNAFDEYYYFYSSQGEVSKSNKDDIASKSTSPDPMSPAPVVSFVTFGQWMRTDKSTTMNAPASNALPARKRYAESRNFGPNFRHIFSIISRGQPWTSKNSGPHINLRFGMMSALHFVVMVPYFLWRQTSWRPGFCENSTPQASGLFNNSKHVSDMRYQMAISC